MSLKEKYWYCRIRICWLTLSSSCIILGMKIRGYDPYISIDSAWMLPKEVEKAETLEFLFSKSDYISLHVPLSGNTKLNIKKLLDFVKEDAINLSREGLLITLM